MAAEMTEMTEMRILRLTVKVMRWERRGNKEIREKFRVEPIKELVERQQLREYGHIRRMEDNRYPARF